MVLLWLVGRSVGGLVVLIWVQNGSAVLVVLILAEVMISRALLVFTSAVGDGI